MSSELNVKITRKEKFAVESAKLFSFISDFTKAHLYMPHLEQISVLDANRHHWKFKPVGAKGHFITVAFDTVAKFTDGSSIEFTTIEGSGNADISGGFTVSSMKNGTAELSVTFDATATLPFKLPFFVKPVARKMMEMELGRTLGRYLENAKKELEA